MHKITVNGTMDCEKSSLIEAIGHEIELTDGFLERYCSQDIRNILLPIEYHKRGYILSCASITNSWFNGTVPGHNSYHIWIDVSEIEIQVDDIAQLEDPDDWVISGDCAYLYVGYGLSVEFNLEELREAAAKYN